MNILGIHGGVTLGQHEPAAALIVDGNVEAVCEEERYLRFKSGYGHLPYYSIQACLRQMSITRLKT
jgi:predicted NodU family carbamoyl transferase